MKKTFLSASLVALLLGLSARAYAQDEMKPLFVISLKGYQELIDDLDFVGKVSDNPDLGKGIEGLLQLVTQGQGLVGLDKSKPWGLAVSTDGLQFQILGFLPIADLEKFTSALGGVIGEPEKTDDGAYKIEVQGQSLYLKQGGDWTFASISTDFMANPPKDPAALLGGLDKKYDFAVRAYIQNIPEIFRQLVVEQLKLGLEQGLSGEGLQIPGLDQLPGGGQLPGADALPKLTEDQQKLAATLARDQLDAVASTLNEADQITFGVTIDRESGKTLGDLTVTALANSKTAEEMARMSDGKTRFGGFKIDGAALTLNVSLALTQNDITQVKQTVAAIQEQLNTRIDDIGIGDDHIKDLLKGFVKELFDINQKTIESGRVDLGAALTGKGPFSLLLGGYISDSEAATKLFDKLVNTVESEAGFYGIQKNAVEHKGVKFSTVLLPVPPGEEGDAIVKIFGSEIELVIGIGDKAAYLSLGRDGVDSLKQAIDASEAAADKAVPPVELSASLGPLVKLASDGKDADPSLALVAGALANGKDRITVTLKPVENGTNLHFDGEEGILKIIGALITSAGPGLPQF